MSDLDALTKKFNAMQKVHQKTYGCKNNFKIKGRWIAGIKGGDMRYIYSCGECGRNEIIRNS